MPNYTDPDPNILPADRVEVMYESPYTYVLPRNYTNRTGWYTVAVRITGKRITNS